MGSNEPSSESHDDPGLAGLYHDLEERITASYAEAYDLDKAATRYEGWLQERTSTGPALAQTAARQAAAASSGRGSTASDPWGRVAEDGAVFVRTADGERQVGSWQAGSPDEALAFFKRKFETLETEVSLLEQRLASTHLSPAQARATIGRLVTACTDASAIGDLAGLLGRLERLSEIANARREEHRIAREHARSEALEVKERIVAEAERIAAEATHWKISGERMRELLEEWKAAPRGDRTAETALWKRLSAARNQFTKRRKAYLALPEEQRESIRARRRHLVAQVEALADSTDWKRDAELAQNAIVKEQLLAEAEKLLAEAEELLPVTGTQAAWAALRGIQERWERAGQVPRDSADRLEGGLRRIEDALRKAEDAHWRRSSPEALSRARSTVGQIRAAISQLEDQLAKARAKGDARAQQRAEEALAARKAWLAEAEHSLADYRSQ